MKKFESLMTMSKAGLPICNCHLYNWDHRKKAIDFADWLRKNDLGVGLRSELHKGNDTGISCPFIVDITNEEIERTFTKYKDKYRYIISEYPNHRYDVDTQGVVYLLCNRQTSFFVNEVDNCTCRDAIEKEPYCKNIVHFVRNWDSPVDKYTTIRRHLIRAAMCNSVIYQKRIEWTWFRKRGLIFWQLSMDVEYEKLHFLLKEHM